MTLDEIFSELFPAGHSITVREDHLILGEGRLDAVETVSVIGIAGGEALGIDQVLPLSERVLDVIATGTKRPILVVVDTQGQRMARRDEMLGLNEYLAHLAKCLLLAGQSGHRTVGLVYGRAAAGAFLATALATDTLVALPGAEPAVMDLPSMARVTKLPEDKLRAMSETTPVFAPGIDSMIKVGAVSAVWDLSRPLVDQLRATLEGIVKRDERDVLGAKRGGRPVAASVARRVAEQAASPRHDF